MDHSKRDMAILAALQKVAAAAAVEGYTLMTLGAMAAEEGLWEKWEKVFTESLNRQEEMLAALQGAMALLQDHDIPDAKELH